MLFDEYHERSLHADAGLALALDAQQHVAPDLKLLAMSATLDGARVAALLGGAPVIESEGRMFPVEVRYLGTGLPPLPGGPERIDAAVSRAVQRALREAQGDALVFLPGAGEIRRTQARLAEAALGSNVDLLPLYGELKPGNRTLRSRRQDPGVARSCSRRTSRRRA